MDVKKINTEIRINAGWNELEYAIQYFTALYHRVDLIVSHDRRPDQKSLTGFAILHPDEFVSRF